MVKAYGKFGFSKIIFKKLYLSHIVSGDTTHVVMDGRKDGNGFLGDIDTGENLGSFGDTGESFVEKIRRKMVQV